MRQGASWSDNSLAAAIRSDPSVAGVYPKYAVVFPGLDVSIPLDPSFPSGQWQAPASPGLQLLKPSTATLNPTKAL